MSYKLHNRVGGAGAGDRVVAARLRVAVLSTVPPRQCGIATFADNLFSAITTVEPGVHCPSAAITREGATDRYGDSVCWRVTQGSGSSFRALASDLNKSDVDLVSVQHEFGLYGGWDGTYTDHLGPFLAMLHKPAITTFHTVLPAPEPAQLAAVCDIAARSAAVIVMTDVAQRLLVTVYGLPAGKIHVIPHGVPVMRPGLHPEVRARLGLAGRTVITTFGLVDPRKGIEFMVEGMATVAQRDPRALYLVLGKSHPELVAREGERYRATIEDLVARRGLQGHVRLVNRYLAEEDIVDYLEATDVYVTPYLDPNQITSGTLAYALGAGRAIVSTSYLHAVEALDRGRGLLVDFRSAGSLSAAVLRVIEEPGLRSDLERSAHAWGATTYWPQVARTTAALFRRVAAEVRPQRKGPVVNARTRVAVAGPR